VRLLRDHDRRRKGRCGDLVWHRRRKPHRGAGEYLYFARTMRLCAGTGRSVSSLLTAVPIRGQRPHEPPRACGEEHRDRRGRPVYGEHRRRRQTPVSPEPRSGVPGQDPCPFSTLRAASGGSIQNTRSDAERRTALRDRLRNRSRSRDPGTGSIFARSMARYAVCELAQATPRPLSRRAAGRGGVQVGGGRRYGWPFCYTTGASPECDAAGVRRRRQTVGRCESAPRPLVASGHWAPDGMTFYTSPIPLSIARSVHRVSRIVASRAAAAAGLQGMSCRSPWSSDRSVRGLRRRICRRRGQPAGRQDRPTGLTVGPTVAIRQFGSGRRRGLQDPEPA